MKIFDSILDTIGNTPIVNFSRIKKIMKVKPEILAKLELFNPCGSVKDRIGIAMLEAAEKAGEIKEKAHIVEATSGNTGIALAMACAVKGYKLTLTMPELMATERINMLKALGAEIMLTDPLLGMKGAVEKADEIAKNKKGVFIPHQFKNLSNPEIHSLTTAREIVESVDGNLSAFVAGVGTGGTITGIAEVLKKEIDGIKIFAVEPKESPVLSGGRPGPHRIQGIGAGFIPDVYNPELVDEVIQVNYDESLECMKQIGKIEGIFVGVSSGAALCATLKIADQFLKDDRLLCLLPDTGERYLCSISNFD